jgi:hypothetical protein
MVHEKEPEENPFTARVPLYNQTDPPMSVKGFLRAVRMKKSFYPPEQTMRRSATVANRARQILQRCWTGRDRGCFRPRAKLPEIFVATRGWLVDFSSPISANHAGGMLNEQATVYSIVNSLTYNLPKSIW